MNIGATGSSGAVPPRGQDQAAGAVDGEVAGVCVAVTSVRRCFGPWSTGRPMATKSFGDWKSAAADSGDRAPARCTRLCSCSRSRACLPPEKRVASGCTKLTDQGRAEVESQAAGGMPWESPDPASGRFALRKGVGQLFLAAQQVAMAGDESRVERATEILKEARQKLYQLLAED